VVLFGVLGQAEDSVRGMVRELVEKSVCDVPLYCGSYVGES
jgi:hypothetical protein